MVFPFYSLPPEAREMVLEYVDVETKLKMMGINYDLRGYVLKNGPFPKNVDYMLVIASFNTLRNGRIFTRMLKLRIKCGMKYNFIVRKTVTSTSRAFTEAGNLRLQPSHLGIFKNIKFPKFLELRFDFYVGDVQMLAILEAPSSPLPFGLEELFSNFRLFKKLLILIDGVGIADAVFKHLKPSVLGSFKMQFDLNNDILPELEFYTEHFRSYLQNQLADCAVICLPDLPASAISCFEVFSQTNVKEFCFENISSPVEVVKSILDNGIPSKFDEASILLSGVIDEKQAIKSIMLKAAGIIVINPESWAGMKAIQRCLKIIKRGQKVNDEMKMEPDYIFEQQLSSTKKCTYLLKYVDGGMEFFAKNSRIFS